MNSTHKPRPRPIKSSPAIYGPTLPPEADTIRPVAHIRAGVVRASRRIMGSRGSAGHTLCGAELTAYDVLERDAERATPADLSQWVQCDECRRRIVAR